MRFPGLTVSMLSIKFFASGVTVSHSGEGYWGNESIEEALKDSVTFLRGVSEQ